MAFSLALGVTPESLKSQATTLQGTASELRKVIGELQKTMGNTNGYWKGEAGDLHRANLADHEADIMDALARVDSYPTDVLQMAGIYVDAESTNQQVVAQLTTDVAIV